MADQSAHDRFLRGEPLTAGLAAMREGRDPQPASRPLSTERKAFNDLEREFTRSERLDLKEWQEMPGWELYRRIAEKSIHFHQKRAIALSQDDPLSNRDAVANAWAYVNMLRRAVAELEMVVSMEVAELEKEQ